MRNLFAISGWLVVFIVVGMYLLVQQHRTQQHRIPPKYVAPLVMHMENGEIGWIRSSSVIFNTDFVLRVRAISEVESHASTLGLVRIMPLDGVICIDGATLGRNLRPDVYLRYDRTLPARICSGETFTWGVLRDE